MIFLLWLVVYFGIGYTTSPFIWLFDAEQEDDGPDWGFLLIGWPLFWLYTFLIAVILVGKSLISKPDKNSANKLGIGA